MNNFKSERKFIFLMTVLFLAIGCKTQSLETSAPFTINEKVYFDWVGGKQGTQGTTVRLRGKTSSLSISFSKIFFQNREYGVVPQFNSEGFLLEASFSEMTPPVDIMGTTPEIENVNKPPKERKKISHLTLKMMRPLFSIQLMEEKAIIRLPQLSSWIKNTGVNLHVKT